MGCGGCGKGGNRHTGGGNLSRYAFLTPRQLKLLEQQKTEEEKDKENK